uniref:Putative wd40 repeat protein n=1 Tax=Lutzomyia longipalpis TaxID=7200 RepID=A0A1B0GKZ2_LUTLO
MNLELLESFGQNYPEEFDGSLDCISLALTCTFNRYGTLLAVGCNDGRIVIWDFLTRGIAKIISAHVHPVCSLSWSRTSTDNNVCIWDILNGDCEYKFRFPSPVLKVQFHPRDSNRFLVCPMRYAAVLVEIGGSHKLVPLDQDGDLNIIATFDRRGEYLFTGNGKGKVLVFKTETMEIVATFKIINGEPEAVQKLQDLVNKTTWKKCCFSGDGEYICAGSARQHALYVWEKSVGNLVKILHGTKGELLLDVVWHPVRPIIASISSGLVSIWAQNQVENWSAFAPDFKELDENVEYEERESEFDITDEDKSIDMSNEAKMDEEIEVDVCRVEQIAAFCSSDEEYDDSNSLQFLPMAPEVEDPEEGWNSQENPPQGENGENAAPNGNHVNRKKKTKTYDIHLEHSPADGK